MEWTGCFDSCARSEHWMSDRVTTYEEELKIQGKLVYHNHGCSMLPLIREDRDLIIIEPRPEDRCRKYDVVLYKRNDRYILHRILKVLEQGYVLCGDHNWKKDPIVYDEAILGVLTAVVRNGKEIRMDSFPYRIYVHLWSDLFPLRALVLRSAWMLRKIKRKLTG